MNGLPLRLRGLCDNSPRKAMQMTKHAEWSLSRNQARSLQSPDRRMVREQQTAKSEHKWQLYTSSAISQVSTPQYVFSIRSFTSSSSLLVLHNKYAHAFTPAAA